MYVSENEDDDEEVVEGADISKQVTAKRHKGEKSIGAATVSVITHFLAIILVCITAMCVNCECVIHAD